MLQQITQLLSKQHLRADFVTEGNSHILLNLSQAYEAEFSPLTQKMPDKYGVFHLDALPVQPYTGYLLYYKDLPIGFAVIDISKAPYDIAEFYIIPVFRKRGFGKLFSHYIFDTHQGYWEVKQISGANLAVQFWRNVIDLYTKGKFQEEIMNDPKWGVVNMKSFSSR